MNQHPEPTPGPDAARFVRIQDCDFWRSLHIEFVQEFTNPGRTALDVGCGPGLTCGLLSDRGWDVIGVDHREDMISAARHRHRAARFELADIYQLPDTMPGPFDLVTASNLLFYLSDPLHAVAAMAAVAAPGGTVAMLNPAPSLDTARAERLAREWGLGAWDTEVLWTWARLRELNGVFDTVTGSRLFARAGLHSIKAVPVGRDDIGLVVVGATSPTDLPHTSTARVPATSPDVSTDSYEHSGPVDAGRE